VQDRRHATAGGAGRSSFMFGLECRNFGRTEGRSGRAKFPALVWFYNFEAHERTLQEQSLFSQVISIDHRRSAMTVDLRGNHNRAFVKASKNGNLAVVARLADTLSTGKGELAERGVYGLRAKIRATESELAARPPPMAAGLEVRRWSRDWHEQRARFDVRSRRSARSS
jgi:hypothetical protein